MSSTTIEPPKTNQSKKKEMKPIEPVGETPDIEVDGSFEQELFVNYIIPKARKIQKILEEEFSDDIEPPSDKEKAEYSIDEMGYVFTKEICGIETQEEVEELIDMDPVSDILVIMREFCQDKGIELD